MGLRDLRERENHFRDALYVAKGKAACTVGFTAMTVPEGCDRHKEFDSEDRKRQKESKDAFIHR